MLLLLWSLVAKKKKRLLPRPPLLWLRPSKRLTPLLLLLPTLPLLLPPPHLLPLVLQKPPLALPLLLLTPLATPPRPLQKLPSSKLTLAALQQKKPPSGGFFSSAPSTSRVWRANVGQAELSLLLPAVGGHAGISKIKLLSMYLPQNYD